MYLPDIETFKRDSDRGYLVPVFRELYADMETPISVFLKLCSMAPSFLLESVERGEQVGRYSFIGTNPYMVLKTYDTEALLIRSSREEKITLGSYPEGPDPLHLVQRLLPPRQVAKTQGLPRFLGGAVGYLAYDVARFFEKLDDYPQDELQLPGSAFMFVDTLVVFDHLQHKMSIVSNVAESGTGTATYQEAVDKIDAVTLALSRPLSQELPYPVTTLKQDSQLTSNFTSQEFCDIVNSAKEYILAGDAFQIVLSQRLCRQTSAKPFDIYRALRVLNPSPYMFYLDWGDFQLVGSSPEMLVKLEGEQVEYRPIAGTRPRGKTADEDEDISHDLLSDPKELAEHMMLVDLGRNDVGRVCRYGSVKVTQLKAVERYSHVMHLVSSIKGRLREDYDAFSLLRSCFPAGTVTGAPKIRAMDIITELEKTRRGPYAGSVGYFDFSGNMDTCITIRTIVMKDGIAYLQGGAGIVADSVPENEYQETLNKLAALDGALQMAESRQRGLLG